jgi:putative membrane protein
MSEFLLEHYQIIKALHIISIISWMAGLLYLPRLFVYHFDAPVGSELSETFKVMERKLLRVIMNPAMAASWLFGILMLVANTALLQAGWMHGKLLLVFIMTGMHHIYMRWRKQFENDERAHSGKFYRLWNEAPAVLMILIVIFAVVEPF